MYSQASVIFLYEKWAPELSIKFLTEDKEKNTGMNKFYFQYTKHTKILNT